MKGPTIMNWQNLRRNKCPKDGADLKFSTTNNLVTCTFTVKRINVWGKEVTHHNMCNFAIQRSKMEDLLVSMNKEAITQPIYMQSEEGEDLRKAECCGFCHSVHLPEEACEGFGV